MIPTALTETTSGNSESSKDSLWVRTVLEKFERSKILEVYFLRLDGRVPDEVPADFHELYEIELNDIKAFLLGQHPQDTLLHKIFRIMA